MALEIKQQLKLSQQLVITPQLQQAIKLLQLSQPELVEMVEQQLMENPLLEEESQNPLERSEHPPEIAAERGEIETLGENHNRETLEVGGKEGDFKEEPADFDWNNYFNTYNTPELSQGFNGEDLPSYENTLANKDSLFDHLLWQLQLSNMDADEVEMGTRILGGINEEGYFIDSLEEIAAKTPYSIDFAEHVLEKIQDFDPPGVAARNLEECLLLQVRPLKEHYELLKEIICKYLHHLERRDYPRKNQTPRQDHSRA